MYREGQVKHFFINTRRNNIQVLFSVHEMREGRSLAQLQSLATISEKNMVELLHGFSSVYLFLNA
jgi:hypothetical protein